MRLTISVGFWQKIKMSQQISLNSSLCFTFKFRRDFLSLSTSGIQATSFSRSWWGGNKKMMPPTSFTTFTLSRVHFRHFHTFTLTLSPLSHFHRFHTFTTFSTFTLLPVHFHTFTAFTLLPPSHFHVYTFSRRFPPPGGNKQISRSTSCPVSAQPPAGTGESLFSPS